MTKKIIIADDHELVLQGLIALLETASDIEIVATAQNGQEALDLIQRTEEVDLLLLDINMPELDGIEVTRFVKENYPEIKVLILSMYQRSEFIKTLITAGADGYILKNAGKAVLLEAIEALSKGERYFSKEVLDSMIDSYTEKRKTKDLALVELSTREKEVVRLIAMEKSTAEIAEELFLSAHTINSHRKSILSKLDVKNAAGIFRYALHSGLIKGFDI